MLQVESLRWGVADWISKQQLDLQIPAHTLVVVKGPNGCGKTSLLKTLSGHWRPKQGRFSSNFRRALYLPSENYGLLPELTMFENMELVSQSRGHSREVRKIFVENLMRAFGFSILAKKIYKNASKGERQWLHLLLFLYDPDADFILLDEPFHFLDQAKQNWLRAQTQYLLSDSKKTFVISAQRDEDIPMDLTIVKKQILELSE